MTDLSVEYETRLRAQISQMGDAAKAKFAQTTGIDLDNIPGSSRVNEQTIKGAQATADLVSHGFDPSNPADNAKIVHAVAGGLALIVPIGTALAAAVEVLWVVGNAIACPVTHLFGGTSPACGDPPCAHTGPEVTPGLIIALSELPTAPQGSFTEFVIACLAVQAANAFNCKGAVTPDHVVDAAVNMWNQTHEPASGTISVPGYPLGTHIDIPAPPTTPIFVPPLSPNHVPIVPVWQQGGPGEAVTSAFRPMSEAGPRIQNWANNGQMPYLLMGLVPSFPQMGTPTIPRIVQINAGPLIQQAADARTRAFAADDLQQALEATKVNGIPDADWNAMPPETQAAWRAAGYRPVSEVQGSKGLSSGGQVLLIGGILIGGTIAALYAYSLWQGKPFMQTVKGLYHSVTGGGSGKGAREMRGARESRRLNPSRAYSHRNRKR